MVVLWCSFSHSFVRLFLLGHNGGLLLSGHLFNGMPLFVEGLQFLLGFFLFTEIGRGALVVERKVVLHVHFQDILGEAFDRGIPMSRRVLVKRSVNDGQDRLRIQARQASRVDQVFVVWDTSVYRGINFGNSCRSDAIGKFGNY